MGTKSRETIYGASVCAAAEQAKAARLEADRLACQAWNKLMLAFQGPTQPSPAIGDALNAGCHYLEVRCLGYDTNQTVPPDIIRRPNKWSHLVALRTNKISADDPKSAWWPGER